MHKELLEDIGEKELINRLGKFMPKNQVSDDCALIKAKNNKLLVNNDSLGVIPVPGRTMYIKYRIGGGADSNVGPNVLKGLGDVFMITPIWFLSSPHKRTNNWGFVLPFQSMRCSAWWLHTIHNSWN